MAATIKIKNSSTAGAAPTSSDLVQGELAVNVTDKRLYTENASGTIVELGTNPSVPVTFPDGSASAPSLTNDGDTNTGLFFPAADTVGITTGGTERARVDSSGNLGLGVTPSAWSGKKVLQVQYSYFGAYTAGATPLLYLGNNHYDNGTNNVYLTTGNNATLYQQSQNGEHRWFNAPSGTAGNAITFTQAMTLDASGQLAIGTTTANSNTTLTLNRTGFNQFYMQVGGTNKLSLYADASISAVDSQTNPLVFYTNSAERARIDTSGNLLVGQTSTGIANATSYAFQLDGQGIRNNHGSGTPSGYAYMQFGYAGGSIGSITQNGTTGVLYNLTSDYRLKNNPTPVTGAKEFVMALQPKTWDWWDGSGKGVGFIAHEFMEVAQYSGNGEKDAVDEDGNPVYQSIQPSSSEVMAYLVAHIQELETRLAVLENK